MSSMEKDILRREYNRLTPRPIRGPSRAGGSASRYKRDFKPLSFRPYFDNYLDLKIPASDDTFRVYTSGFQNQPADSLLLVLLHGGGYSGLTWALFTKHIRELCSCRVASIDLRGHGGSMTSNATDLSAITMAHDVGNVVRALLDQTSSHSEEHLPPIVIIGHSMGGALAIHCSIKLQEMLPTIVGIIVIDVVEGTALDALQSMQAFLKGRPKSFPSLENAIEWCLRSGQTRNLEAAKVSMPGQLKNASTNKPATDDIRDESSEDEGSLVDTKPKRLFTSTDQIPEESEVLEDDEIGNKSDPCSSSPQKSIPEPSKYVWRINLSETEPHWKGWFQGLSDLFLNAPVQGKMLLLAGIDNLDKQLTIGQMQGKFQLQVLPQCGHAVHEDSPEKVADTIATFLVRNRFTQAITDFEKPFPSC